MTNPPPGFGDTRRFRVARTVDEFGKDRYFVEDDNADWIGMPFDTPEAAFEEIERLEQDRMALTLSGRGTSSTPRTQASQLMTQKQIDKWGTTLATLVAFTLEEWDGDAGRAIAVLELMRKDRIIQAAVFPNGADPQHQITLAITAIKDAHEIRERLK